MSINGVQSAVNSGVVRIWKGEAGGQIPFRGSGVPFQMLTTQNARLLAKILIENCFLKLFMGIRGSGL